MKLLLYNAVKLRLNFSRAASSNIYSKTLNLPSSKINLSMKNIYENEKKIQKVKKFAFYLAQSTENITNLCFKGMQKR
jgi:hypothetical protein